VNPLTLLLGRKHHLENSGLLSQVTIEVQNDGYLNEDGMVRFPEN